MLKDNEIQSLINQTADQCHALVPFDNPLIIGIHSGGVWVAERLHAAMNNSELLGSIDISFYRDDFSQIGLNPEVKSSNLPDNIDDRNIILVDDVLHTGRTIRAAMNELFDYGRPKAIALAVLIDRQGRELPIQAQATGMSINLAAHQHIKLHNNSGQLSLNVIDKTL